MSMARIDKWIPGVSPDDRTSDVAGRTLRFRLVAVQQYLPLADEKPDEDIKFSAAKLAVPLLSRF